MTTYEEAVLKARRKFLKLNKNQEKELLKLYKELASQLSKEILTCKTSSKDAYLKKLSKIVDINIQQLNFKLGNMIKENIKSSSKIASEVETIYYKHTVKDATLFDMFKSMPINTSRKTVSKLIQGNYYKDGKTLDNRLWNITKKNAKDIDTLIKVNILKGANANELAKQLDKYINPNKVLKARTLEAGISPNISYQAQRLARTSITHAFAETTIENAKNNPFNIGIKWNLSPSHSARMHGRTDICDEYNGRVFKPRDVPLQHPCCICYLTEENMDIDKAIEELKAWTKGENNTKLDEWYDSYNKTTNIHKDKKISSLANKSDNGDFNFKKLLSGRNNKFSNKKEAIYLNNLPEEHYNNIINIVNNAPIKFQQIFLIYLSEIKFLDISYKDKAKYSNKYDGIYLNLEEDKENQHGKGEYTTTFHEIGHLIDKKMKRPSTNSELSESFKNAIIDDINKFISDIRNNVESESELKNVIKDALSSNNRFHSISDIMSGVTKCQIYGKFKHSKSYWEKEGALQRETFAHIFEATIRNDNYKLDMIKNIIPNAYNIFLKMISGGF